MITDFVLDLFYGLMQWIAEGFPVDNTPIGTNGLEWLGAMNYFLPLGELFSVWSVFFALGGTFASVTFLLWVGIGILRGGAVKA